MKRRMILPLVLGLISAFSAVAAAPAWGGENTAAAPAAQTTDLVARALSEMNGAEEIVFAVRPLYSDGHYYANFGHWALDPDRMMHAPEGGQLTKLNLRTGELSVLLDDPRGGIRDPQVHYDGQKILFSYRPGGTKHYHLYEIGTDGEGLRQLTDGPYDDIEPCYLPDGGIVFPSSRCNCFVACWYTPVATLHRMDADGDNLQILSSNIVHDNTPSVLPDGRILYTRWEYVDRAPQKFHGLWSMNPDGTGQMIVFGNMQPPGRWVLMIDAKPIPGSDKLIAVFSPHHGNREHAGHVTIVDVDAGPDAVAKARQITASVKMADGWKGGRDGYRDPFPLSEDCFLVARDKSLLIMDGQGNTQEIHRAEKMVHEPWVIAPRPREPVVPPRWKPTETTGRLILANARHGRNMDGVQPGDVRQLLVLEQLPKPVNFTGVQQILSMNGTFTLKRILGTVPVEPDGSAYFEVPALRNVYFVALDDQGRTVKRMQSFCSVMPGETIGCVGCHERRSDTPRLSHDLLATTRPPRQIKPLANIPDVIDYPRDIQPLLDKYCVECHCTKRPEGRIVLTGDYNEWFTLSYYALFASDEVSDSQGYDEDGNRPARGFGSAASDLMRKIDGSHYDVQVTPDEQKLIQLWIDTGATYPGTYGAYRPGRPPTGHTQAEPGGKDLVTYATVHTRPAAKGAEPVSAILKRRCLTCHGEDLPLGPGIHKTQTFLNVPRYCLNLYNLTHPEQSMVLLAPLAEQAGGYGWCRSKTADGTSSVPVRVFPDKQDPDYRLILSAIQRAQAELNNLKRFDMPGFRPNRHYIRELKRYGVLPDDFDVAKDPIDVYKADRAYWRSLWYRPRHLQSVSGAK